jgi:hypothetical protein
MMGLKLKPKLVPSHKILDGINAGRVLFPRIWFDRDKCKAGLECLRQYRADYDEKARVFRDGPKHDWTSHAADSFRYLAMAYREIKPEAKAADKPIKGVQDMTWDDLLANQPVHVGYERA